MICQLYWTEVDDLHTELFMDADDIMYFDLPDSAFPLSVRRREDGDRILLPGMTHPKRLSRLFIDEKVTDDRTRPIADNCHSAR